jgi:hypothetical protein
MLLLDAVVCDLATLICVKVQRWHRERVPNAELVTVTPFHLLIANAAAHEPLINVCFQRKSGDFELSPSSRNDGEITEAFRARVPIPCPPPMHKVTIPRFMPSRCIECRRRVVSTAPDAPIG